MTDRPTLRTLTAALAACVVAYGCTTTPAVTTDEQTVSGAAGANRPSRAPATAPPTPTPTATPRPVPSATAVPTTGAPTFERGRVLATFETRGLDRTQAREVVCYPTDTGDAFVLARYVLADAAATATGSLPAQFAVELDMAMLQPATAYTLAYRQAGQAGSAIETKTFTIPQASYGTMTEPAGGYTNNAITFDDAGLVVDGTFSGAITWRHALVYDKNRKLVVTAHAIQGGTADRFTIAPVPGIPADEEATVYVVADGRIAFKKILKRAAPVGS